MTSGGEISVHSYSQSFQEVVNGTSIQKIAYVINKWKIGIENNRTIWEKGPVRNGVEGLEKQREQRENTLYLEKTWVYI